MTKQLFQKYVTDQWNKILKSKIKKCIGKILIYNKDKISNLWEKVDYRKMLAEVPNH